MSIAFLCPGQGWQSAGMLHRLFSHPIAGQTITEASHCLGIDCLELDTDESLTSTVGAQLAIFVAGVAVSRVLQQAAVAPDLVTGLSVGAFTAAVAGGALSYRDGLLLVRLRAELMATAYPKGFGLSAIVGLDERRVTRIVSEINTAESPVYIANVNAPTQIVITGSDRAMSTVLARAKQDGAKVTKRLPVSVPSHCELLNGVAEELRRALAEVEIRPPIAIYVTNRRARATRDPMQIREDLATNVAHTVRWHDATTVAYERGIRLFVELPPGDVLTTLVSAAFPDARSISADNVGLDGLANAARYLGRAEN
ncbi:MAG: malonate decarboxylase subunit epsilon [Verrucomicrobia bacterium]|nr:malonate decarboxylase subunit epsilon [Verrucomicrobiota bacterium]